MIGLKRFLRWMGRIMLIVFSLWLVGSLVLVVSIIFYGFKDYTQSADVIIVLGAGVEADGSASKTLTMRVQKGAELWQTGIAAQLICTGGIVGKAPRSEAGVCKDALLNLGVPESAILIEERSINTETNAFYAIDLMQQHNMQTAVVVSSRYHLLRARWLFLKQGLQVYTSPVKIDYLTPTEITYSYFREWGAFHWQLIRERFDVPHVYVPVP